MWAEYSFLVLFCHKTQVTSIFRHNPIITPQFNCNCQNSIYSIHVYIPKGLKEILTRMYIKVWAKLELVDFSKIRTGSHMKQTRLREGGREVVSEDTK